MIELESKKDLKHLQDFIKMVIEEYDNNALAKKNIKNQLSMLDIIISTIINDEASYEDMHSTFSALIYCGGFSNNLTPIFERAKALALEYRPDYKLCRISDFDEVVETASEALYLLRCNELKSGTLEYEGIERSKNTIKRLIDLIRECQDVFNEKINSLDSLDKIDEEKYNTLRKMLYYITVNYTFSFSMFMLINELFETYNIKNSTRIVWLENMKNYDVEIKLNRNTNAKYYKQLDDRKDRIINMVQFGFENISSVYYEGPRKNELESIAKTIIDCDGDVIAIPNYCGNFLFDGNLTLVDFNYVLTIVLQYYQSIMLKDVQDLNKLENYQDKDLRTLLPDDFYQNFAIYETIRVFKEEQLDLYNDDLNKSEVEESNYTIVFAVSDPSSEKSYFESDLKALPPDLFLIVKDMLVSIKKNGSMSRYPTRTLSDCGGLKEIKNDQIRIFFDYSKNNEIIIIGVAQKKRDNDQTIVRSVRGRNREDFICNPEYEEYLFDNLTSSSHRGGRR